MCVSTLGPGSTMGKSYTQARTMNTPFDIMYNNMKLEGQKIMGFGKYYGRTYQDVCMNDRPYCKWCMSLEPMTFSMYDFQTYIEKVRKFT